MIISYKRPLLIAICIVIFACLLFGGYAYWRSTLDPDTQLRKVSQLPTTSTPEDLEKLGYLNVTNVLPESLPSVNSFLHGGISNRILKTFVETNEDLVVRIFWPVDDGRWIRCSTYYIRGQFLENANSQYQCPYYTVETGNQVTQIWLSFYNTAVENPSDYDLMVYQYTTAHHP